MGRRLTTGRDPYGALADERYERDKPVMDHIKLSSGTIYRILDVADDVGADGPRIVELLGAPRAGGPVAVDHTLTVDQQPELVDRLEELLERIAAEIETDRALDDLASEPRSTWETVLEADYHSHFEVYLKAESIKRLVGFAYEHEIDLYIG